MVLHIFLDPFPSSPIRRMEHLSSLETCASMQPSRDTFHKTCTSDLTLRYDQGQSTKPQLQSWDAAALLNPKASAQQAGPSSLPSRPPSNGPHFTNNHAPQVSFQFSTPNATENFHSHPSRPSMTPDGAATPRSSTPNGMSSMIERMNNVQDRSTVPVAKRRRIGDDSQDHVSRNGFHGNGSSGMLSGYVKQKQQQGQAVPSTTSRPQSTVDLTGGIWTSCPPWEFVVLDLLLTARRGRR